MNQRDLENMYIVIGLCLMFSVIGYYLYFSFVIVNAEWQNGKIYQQCINMKLGDNNSIGYVESIANKCYNSLGTHRR